MTNMLNHMKRKKNKYNHKSYSNTEHKTNTIATTGFIQSIYFNVQFIQ